MIIGCQNFTPAYQLKEPTSKNDKAFIPFPDMVVDFLALE